MSVNALLSTVILVSFIVTVVLAIGSYFAYKMRERGRAPADRSDAVGDPVFFERVYPGVASRVVDHAATDRGDGAR
jgi:hypothetical protein